MYTKNSTPVLRATAVMDEQTRLLEHAEEIMLRYQALTRGDLDQLIAVWEEAAPLHADITRELWMLPLEKTKDYIAISQIAASSNFMLHSFFQSIVSIGHQIGLHVELIENNEVQITYANTSYN